MKKSDVQCKHNDLRTRLLFITSILLLTRIVFFCVWMIFVLFGFTNYMSDEHDTWKKKQSSMAFRIFLIFFCSVCSYPYRQISILNVNKHGLSMSVLLMFMLEIQCPPCRTPNTPMQTLQRLSPCSIRGCARCPCTWTVTIRIRTYK